MMLRLILVGLVTSMGLELPSGRDVSCWAESGRAWANARICELTTPGVEVISAEAPERPAAPAEADQAFGAIAAEMAADFAADRALASHRAPDAESDTDAGCDGDTAATAEVAAVAPAGAEEVAEVVVGLPAGEELAAVAPSAAADEPAAVAAAEEAEEVGDDTPSRADRLAEAVRLTREAAQAWADLVQEPAADEVGCAR